MDKTTKTQMNKLVTNFMSAAKKSKSTVNVSLYYGDDNKDDEFVMLSVFDEKIKCHNSFNFYSFWSIDKNKEQLEKAKKVLNQKK